MTENYNLPTPRSGLFGLWDRFIGPGATLAENTLILVSSMAGAIAAALRIGLLEFDLLQLVIGAVMGFDLIGGAVCNATNTTKRWYHRPEVGWVQHMAFVLPHLVYVAIAARLFRDQAGFDWNYFNTVSISLLLATIAVLVVPAYLKRPVAAGLYLVAMAVGLYGVGLTPGIEWFVPVLFLKLLIGHLVPEELPNRSSTHNSFSESMAASEQDRQQIAAVIEQYRYGFAAVNVEDLKAIWDQDYDNIIYVAQEMAQSVRDWTGVEQYYERVAKSLEKVRTMTVSNLSINVLGEVAYAFCTFHFEGEVKGQNQSRIADGRNTFILHRKSRMWKVIHYHESCPGSVSITEE